MCIRDSYSTVHVAERVKALQADESVRCPRNIYEYVLGGEEDKNCLLYTSHGTFHTAVPIPSRTCHALP